MTSTHITYNKRIKAIKMAKYTHYLYKLLMSFKIMTAVEFLAERYNYITYMRNRDEISAETADEWRVKYLKEAKEMEEQQINNAWQEGAVTAQNDAAKEIEKNYVARVQ